MAQDFIRGRLCTKLLRFLDASNEKTGAFTFDPVPIGLPVRQEPSEGVLEFNKSMTACPLDKKQENSSLAHRGSSPRSTLVIS